MEEKISKREKKHGRKEGREGEEEVSKGEREASHPVARWDRQLTCSRLS